MRLHIRHLTTYRYDDPVAYSIQQLRLTPRTDLKQQTLRWNLQTPGHPRSQVDAHGNTVHMLVLTQSHQKISLLVEGEVVLAQDGHALIRTDRDFALIGFDVAGQNL